MTWYELTLRRYDTNPATGAQDGGKTMSHVESDDEQVIASVMRAAADRLDPPKPPRPVYRSAADRREAADQRFREKLAGYGDADPDGARCRGDACSEGHTYGPGCLLATRPQDVPVPLRDGYGLPNYAHDADCNTIHDAGPDPCPPPSAPRGRRVKDAPQA